MTILHMRYLVFKIMKEDIEKNTPKCPKAKENLDLLLSLLGVYELDSNNSPLFECGYFKKGMGEVINDALKDIYTKLRPQMVPLIESWAKSDDTLMSAIGNSYGDIYETQFEWAKNSRLNA